MSKILQTTEDLEKHLHEQIKFLIASVDSYDAGFEAEAKRMAVTLRILLHDHGENSKSLLGQLGKKDSIKFYDSAIPERPGMLNFGASLVVIPTDNNGKAVPFLDESPPGTIGYVKFEEYWHRHVLFAGQKHFTRENLVKGVSDQDGGAHVDPKLDEEYANLSRNNSFGWKVGSSKSPSVPVEGPTGSVIVWNASFESNRNEEMAEMMPKYRELLLGMNERMFDLILTFKFRRKIYTHSQFMGSASLKDVLPVICPELSYKALVIQDGGTASASWPVLTDKATPELIRQKLAEDMLAYCKLDSEAMVCILNHLYEKIA